MALAGGLAKYAKYVGNELIKSSGEEMAEAGARSALSSLVPSVANKVRTNLATKSGTKMANKGVLNSLVPTTRTNWNSAGDIEGMLDGKFLGANDYYFPSTFSEGALGRATYGANQPIDQKKVAGLVRAIKNNEDIAPIAGFKNNDGLIDIYDGHHRLAAYQKAGKMPRVKLFTRETKDQAYNYADEWAKNAVKEVKQYLPAKPKTGLDEYGMGTIDLRDLNTPKIQYSLDDSGITLYHGTPNKFEDFDDTLPSVWFSDSDKNLRDTGLSIKGGQSMNIMERQLPKDLKIADEELADRLTKQQLQDRGYAGIAYTERGPNGDETYYEIFKPNETLRKMPKVSQSLGYGGYGSYDENVKRVGSSAVAPVREETLPDGWKELEKYLDTSNDRLSLAIGKPRSKITKQDLINFLEDYGYETEGTKDDLWKNALMCIDDMAIDDLYNAGGAAGEFLQERLPFRHNDGLTDATNYYIGAKGRTGRLDAEYSDRLGIGRSNTPMSDRLVNPYSGAGGDYSRGAFGTSPTWANGESGVSTSAHERMHAWQDINKFDWDEEVGDAIDELRGELKKFYHDENAIKKYWGNSKTDYYIEDIEQEARMLQSYLDNEGYTNTFRKSSERGTEWGDEIKPAFDKFFEKLRKLSKKGVALPAVAGLVGIGAMAGKEDDEKSLTM